jgi:pyruvate formate lyase activating enzyme
LITGTVFDIRRYSIHDGPGIRTAVFFKGCPLACAWCHNPESQSFSLELMFRAKRCIQCNDCLDVCPNNAVSRRGDGIYVDRSACKVSGNCTLICPAGALEILGRVMSVESVLAEIERDRVFYEQSGGGATFTGGEPLSQPRFLLELLSACRKRGISTVLDTSGYAPWPVLNEIRLLVDVFLCDLKMVDDTRHRQWTGVTNAQILSNLRMLSEAGSRIQVRIPLIPGINDDEENLGATGEFLAALPHVPPVALLPYHNIAEGKYAGLGKVYGLSELHTPMPKRMMEITAKLRRFGLEILP